MEAALMDAIATYVDGERTEDDHVSALNTILITVQSKRVPLTDLISRMKDHLTNEHDQVDRQRATLLLAELLTRLPTLPLTDAAISTLVKFFASRCADYPCAREVLKGLWALVKSRTLANGFAELIASNLFGSVTVQGLAQPARKCAFEILTTLCARHTSEILGMGKAYITGVIQCMDGEKDPRNLVTCFNLATFVLTQFPAATVQEFIEEIFEVTSCYFPITFTAPKDDPHGVTGPDLVRGLRNCLAANAGMVDFVVPLMLEKLDASSTDVKTDALRTLTACALSYGGYPWAPHLKLLWNTIKKEVLHSSEAEVSQAALECLVSFAKVLCPDAIAGVAVRGIVIHWEVFMKNALAECLRELRVPDSKMARSYARMIAALLSATGNSMTRGVAEVWPPLKSRYKSPTLVSAQREALLDLMLEIIRGAATPFVVAIERHPLSQCCNDMIATFTSSLTASTSSERVLAIRGLARMCTLPTIDVTTPPAEPKKAGAKSGAKKDNSSADSKESKASGTVVDLEGSGSTVASSSSSSSDVDEKIPAPQTWKVRLVANDKVNNVVASMIDRCLTDSDADVRTEALTSLVAITAFHSDIILAVVLPVVLAALTAATSSSSSSGVVEMKEQKSVSSSSSGDGRSLTSILRVISALSSAAPTIFASSLPPLIAAIGGDQLTLAFTSGSVAAATTRVLPILTCIADTVAVTRDAARTAFTTTTGAIWPALMTTITSGKVLDARMSQVAATIVVTSVAAADASQQAPFITSIVDSWLKNGAVTSASQLSLLPVWCMAIGAYHRSLTLPHVNDVLTTLINTVTRTSAALPSSTASLPVAAAAAAASWFLPAVKCIAAIINKQPKGSALDTLVEQLVTGRLLTMSQSYDIAATPIWARRQATIALFWAVRALGIRSYNIERLLNEIVTLIVSPSAYEDIALDVEALVIDSNDLLTLSSSAIMSPGQLSKQRLFVQCLPILQVALQRVPPTTTTSSAAASSSSSTSSSARTRLLLTLATLLRHQARTVTLAHLPQTLPYIMQSLSSPLLSLRVATLHSVVNLVRSSVTAIEDHIGSLIPMLLELTTYQPSPQVRATAIECLDAITALPYTKLHPYKITVVNALAAAVDDKKRNVRAAAVHCRNEWYVLGAKTT